MNDLFVTELDVKFESRHDFENAILLAQENIVADSFVIFNFDHIIGFINPIDFTLFVTLCREAGLNFTADTI
jgi:hypothetical protein